MHKCYHFFLPFSHFLIHFSPLFNESRVGLEKLCVTLDHLQHNLILLSYLGLDMRSKYNNNYKLILKLHFFSVIFSKLTSNHRSAHIPLFDFVVMSSFLKEFKLPELLQFSVS